MRPLAADRTTPNYLVANSKLARAIRAGDPIRLSDLELDSGSQLLMLRRRQDEAFACAGTPNLSPPVDNNG